MAKTPASWAASAAALSIWVEGGYGLAIQECRQGIAGLVDDQRLIGSTIDQQVHDGRTDLAGPDNSNSTHDVPLQCCRQTQRP